MYTCPKKMFDNKKLFTEMWSQISIFSANSTLAWSFWNFTTRISVMWFTTNSLSKMLFCIQIDKQMAEISFKKGWKTWETWIKSWFSNALFIRFLGEIQHSFDNISAICWPIWMQYSVFETLLVVDNMTEIWIWNFKYFMRKLGSEVEIWWKKWDLWPHFLE
jgi:hypothetical protein